MANRLRAINKLWNDGIITATEFREITNELNRNAREIRNRAVEEVLDIIRKAYHNFSGYDLDKMTKYGNETAEQKIQSYSTMMMYEVAYEFDDLIDSIEEMKEWKE